MDLEYLAAIPFLLSHPQDEVFPLRRFEPVTRDVCPQSQRHFQAASFPRLPDLSSTTSLPYLLPSSATTFLDPDRFFVIKIAGAVISHPGLQSTEDSFIG